MKKTLCRLTVLLVTLLSLPSGAWGQTWDFTNWSEATVTNLTAEGSGWTASGDNFVYDTNASKDAALDNLTLQANNVGIAEFSDVTYGTLHFYIPKASDKARITIKNPASGKALLFASKNEKVYVPGLVSGKKVTIHCKSGDAGKTAKMLSVNNKVVAVNQAEASTDERRDEFVVLQGVSTATSVAFYKEGDGSVNLYSITIEDATPADLQAAGYFGTDDFVSTTTLWTFDQYGIGDVPFSDTNAYSYNGLYIRQGDTAKDKISEANNANITLNDSKAIYTYTALGMSNGRETNTSTNASTKASGINTYQFGLNIGVRGTLYVRARVSASSKNFNIAFNGSRVLEKTPSNTSDYQTYTYTATSPGTFVFSGAGAYLIAAVKFVPTDATTPNPTKTITMPASGYMTFSDINGTESNRKLTVSEITSSKIIPACTGVILVGEPSAEYTMTMADANMIKLNAAYGLRPVISDVSLKDTDINGSNTFNHYAITHTESNLQFDKFAEGGANLPANTAYYRIRIDQITDETKSPLYLQLDEMPAYTLTIVNSDNGNIVVKSGDNTTTGTSFLKNTTLTLTATGNDHYQFDYWKVDDVEDEVNTTNVLTLTMTDNKKVEAVYKEVQNTLTATVSPEESGSIEVRIGDNTEVTAETGFTSGTELKLTPVAATGYEFKEWQDGTGTVITSGVDGTTHVLSLTINNDQTVKAVFVKKVYNITIPTFENGQAQVESPSVTAGETVTLKVTPEVGYMVDELTVKNGDEDIEVTTVTENAKYTFVMPAAAPTITITFKEIPTIYGTYDFRQFAKTAFTANGEASVDESDEKVTIGTSTETKVMKGTFTGKESVTVSGSMKLNNVIGMIYSADAYKMALSKTGDDATTGLAIPRGSSGQVELVLYGLKQGDWFKMETGDIPLYFNKVNNGATIEFYDIDDTEQTAVVRNTALVSGKIYVAKKDISSLELYYNTSDYKSGNAYLYALQVSNGDAVPAPTIGNYNFATGKVDITVNSSLKSETPTVYYTTNGDEPTTGSSVYDPTEKITLTVASTIKAIAVVNGVQSAVVEKLVQLEMVDVPAVGDYADGKTTITAGATNNPTSGVTVTTYYTLDGSTPSATNNDGSFTEASKAIDIDQTRIVKSISISSTGVESEVAVKKIVVDAATPATTWDFVNDETLGEIKFGDLLGVTGYYSSVGSDNIISNSSNNNFVNLVNSGLHAKMSWLLPSAPYSLSNVAGKGLMDTSYRAFSINDLHVGDKIYVHYTTTDDKKMAIHQHESHGDGVKLDGTEVAKKSVTAFDSGAAIEVTAVDNDFNYVMLKPGSKNIYITKIEINPVYQITGVKGTGIADLTITTPADKTFDDSFARGTQVTLKATVDATGGEFLWTDGSGNTLTPSETDASELTVTLTGDMTVNVSYSRAKIWDFSELTAGDITKVTESQGLYYRAGESGRKITVKTTDKDYTWNFPDGTVCSKVKNVGNFVQMPANSAIAPADDLTPATKLDETLTSADDSNNRSLAFTTTEAGTVYVAFRGTAAKDYKLFFKSASGESYTLVGKSQVDANDNTKGILFYTAPEGGHFLMGGDATMNVYYVKFEPTDAANIYTLTETANPTDGGSVKKEIIYGDTPNYYETPANTFLAGTQLRLTPSAAVGYGFSYWGDDATDQAESKTVTMSANQSVTVNFTEVKHQVTVAAAENGSAALQVGGETVTLTDGKAEIGEGAEVTVLATPALFYGVSAIEVTKTGDATTTVPVTNGKFTLPDYDVTVAVTFAEEKKYSETTAKTWKFDDADETINTIVDFGNGVYLRGGSNAFTKVASGSVTSVTLGGETVNVNSALQTPKTFTAPDAGITSATAVSPYTSASGIPMIAVNADTKGTVYVAASPVADGTGQIRIYFGDGTEKPAQVTSTSIPSKDEVYTASYTTYGKGTFYIGTTVAANLYAVKFVPQASADGVTLTQDGTSYVLSNGKVTAVINEKGQVDQLLTEDGKYVVKAGSSEAGCLDYTSNGSNRELQKSSEKLTITTVKETSDMVELRFTNDKNNLAQTWSVGYIMRKDVSGLYTYATMEGAKDGSYQEARLKWRPNASFNYAWVSDDVQGQMPDYARLVDDNKVQDATFTLADGTIYTKYDWANYMKDDQLHGVMNTTNGAWLIAPNMEWMNGGVQKQELTVHADSKGPVLLQMLQGEHFGAAAYNATAGSKHFYGPTLLYINSGETKEAMIADAKKKAAEEVAAWPYAWFSHDDYPNAAGRGTVTGTVTLDNKDFSTTKLQVILADASTDDPLQQSGGYQYATEATSTDGKYAFTIQNVRPGSYTVFAYALNGDATGILKSSKAYSVAAGSNDVGTIAWTPAKYEKKLWQIGEADHTTSGFKLSDHKRQYGLWDNSIVADAGIPTALTYTVGTSKTADWYYAQLKDNSTWTVKFNTTETYTSPLHLTIAVAGVSRKPTLTVQMNGTEVHKAAYPDSDGSLYRSGVLSGRYGLIEVEIPATAMKSGDNELTLALSGGDSGIGGLLYDCIKLEAGESEVIDLGDRLWDFSEWTFDEGTTKKNLTVVTNSKNLYYRAGPKNDTSDGRSIAINKNSAGPFTWTFPDGETYTRTKTGNYLSIPGNGTLAPANDLTPAAKLGEELPSSEDSNNRSVAFTTTKPGTVYVAFRGSANRDYQMFFKPASGEGYNLVTTSQVDATDTNKGILFYTAAEGGDFLIGGAANMNVYMIKFEPAETTYKLTTNVQPANCGTIKKSIVYTVDGTEKTYATTDYATVFLPGIQLSLTAAPNGNNIFKGWDGTTNTGSKTVTMSADQTVVANFEKVVFTATYLPEEMYQEQGEFNFDKETTVTVWTAERNSTSGAWEAKSRSDYQYLTNMDTNKVSVRVGVQSIVYGEDNSVRLSRPMAIHNLDVDDEITVLYAGAGSLASVTTERGDAFTIDGSEAEAGKAIPSGALLKVTKVSESDNYVVIGPASSSPVYIKGIYINTKAPEFLHTPAIELKEVKDDTVAVYTISYDEGATLHYQLSTDSEEQEGGTTGSFDLNVTESAKMTAWTTKGDLTSEKLEATVFAPTPAPSVDGNFDFSEASEDLPMDIEVTLDSKNSVVVEGETFYKPTALTAATFDDKFAFSETTASDKIKIRTNRQLAFAKGTDMDMAILNLTKGDIIAIDYNGGTIEFGASDIITTDQSVAARRAVSANETMVSGENYVVTGDGDLILHLKLGTAINVAKMVLTRVATPSTPKMLDFVTTQEEEEALEEGNAVTVYFNGQDASTRFFRLTNDSEWLPAEGKISAPSGKAGLTNGGLKIDRNRFAIHDLAVGDTIKIRFYGGELTYEGHATKGDKISVKSTGEALSPGDALKSGMVIVVDKVDYLNNYLVFMLDKTCTVSGIFINRPEVEKIISPSLRDRTKGLVQVTPGRSTMEREVFTCYTTDGTEPSMVNGTSGLMSEVFDVEFVELYDCDIVVKVLSYSRDGAMSKMTEMTVHVNGILTDINGVPTIDGKPVAIYDLRGRKVQTMMKGQIYIIKGKKYLYK